MCDFIQLNHGTQISSAVNVVSNQAGTENNLPTLLAWFNNPCFIRGVPCKSVSLPIHLTHIRQKNLCYPKSNEGWIFIVFENSLE